MYNLPEPLKFNPLKHHLSYIREYIGKRLRQEKTTETDTLVKELKNIGSSVMDVYKGPLNVTQICYEVISFLESLNLMDHDLFREWAGRHHYNFKIATLSDSSRWMLKYNNDLSKFVHLFPARMSPHSFRVKANTLKSAIIYYIIIGKDYITREDLNYARSLIGLSPVKSPEETEAITEMIEILRMI
jgi:hypothetical protein